jgi:uncharacterized membrane protein YkoI
MIPTTLSGTPHPSLSPIPWFIESGMKRGNFSKLVLLSALALPAYAEKVQFDQLPPDLQQKIRAQVGSAAIEDIDRDVKDGRTIYEVAYKENGQHREAQIEYNTPSTATSTSSAVDSRKMSYDELPQNIKNAVNSYVQAAEVNDVDRQVRDGRVTYEIGYKVNGGAQQELLVADNGQILNRNSAVASSSTATTTPPPYRNRRGVIPGQPATASVNTRTVQYQDLPSAVRKAAESRLHAGGVTQVIRTIQNGNVNYQIDFKKEDGRNQQLVVAEDGRIMSDQFTTASGVGSAASVQSGTSSSSTTTTTDYSNITTPIQLANAQEVNRAQIPVGVARTMRNYTVNTNIKDIQRGTWDGREVYQVGFVDNNNQYVQLQLDASGNVIYDPRRTGSSTGNLLNNIGRLFDNK